MRKRVSEAYRVSDASDGIKEYHRPVEGFNIGKKGEHKERVFFDENFNTSKQCVKKS